MAQSSVDSDRLSSAGISTHSSGTAGTISGSVVGVRVGESGLKREDEDEYSLGPLPPMWEKAFTPSGEVYFIDHNSGTSHWLDPRLARVRKHSLGECGEDELPYGWERVTDERYGSYYVDHINRRTQYENPVLQARRLRAEKMAVDNGSDGPPLNGEELRGDRFTVTLTKGTQGLGFTLIGAEGIPEAEGYLQIRSIVPNSPAWIDGGLQPGDVVVGVGGRAVRGLAHAQVAQIFQSITPGTEVVLHLVRGYPLTFDSADPNTRVLSTLAVEATDATDSVAMQQLTMALRSRFNLESPGGAEGAGGAGSAGRAGRAGGWTHDPPPRCPSADHLLTLTEHSSRGEPGQQLELSLCRGAAGFGFTIADSVHGQKVKKVLDRSRCAGLREGDLLLQIGDTDVRHAPHQHVVQVLKECPLLQQTALVVWRRARAPRSRSATRAAPHLALHDQGSTHNGARSKTPTAEQLRSSAQESLRDRLNGTPVEATYAVPEHKGREGRPGREGREGRDGRLARAWQPWQEPETWVDNSNNIRNWAEHAQKWDDTNGQKWDEGNGSRWEEGERWEGNGERWGDGNWGEVPTPTVHVDMNTAYWRGNASVADSSDNGGFPEDGMLPSPATAAVGAMTHSPHNSTGVVGSPSPGGASASERLLRASPSAHSPLSAHSPHSHHSQHSPHSQHSLAGRPNTEQLRLSGASPARVSPLEQRPIDYPQVEAGGTTDPEADVMVRLARSDAGFGFRIVGGTEDGSRVAVGYVVPGGPAEGLLRAGDLLTSVEGAPLAGESHARAVARVVAAAARGHVTLGVRHNRADVKHNNSSEPSPHEMQPACYNILHPAPVYPPQPMPMYEAGWAGPYDVTVSRADGEGFGFVVISSTNKATSTIGQLIPNSPAARCGLLRVGDTILAINRVPVRNLPHPEVVALIKRSGARVTLTVQPHHAQHAHYTN